MTPTLTTWHAIAKSLPRNVAYYLSTHRLTGERSWRDVARRRAAGFALPLALSALGGKAFSHRVDSLRNCGDLLFERHLLAEYHLLLRLNGQPMRICGLLSSLTLVWQTPGDDVSSAYGIKHKPASNVRAAGGDWRAGVGKPSSRCSTSARAWRRKTILRVHVGM